MVERAVIWWAGKAQTAARAGAIARICNVARAPEGSSIGHAAHPPMVNVRPYGKSFQSKGLPAKTSGQLPDLG
jgi:hypothetical protein